MKHNEPPVVVEQTFAVPAQRVWDAITDVSLMRQWYFDNIPDFQPVVGFKTQFNVSTGERDFPHMWEVIESNPPEKLVYTWRFEGYDGDSYVTFELSPEGEATRLQVTATVTEDFSDDIPEFQRESAEGGWKYFIHERLKEFLER